MDRSDTRSATFAEYQILSDLISNPGYIGMVKGRVRPGMFTDKAASKAWEVILEMDGKGETIDLSTVGVRIPHQVVAEIMKPEYNMGVCTELTVMSHCSALMQADYRRRICNVAWELVRESQDTGVSYDSLMAHVGEISKVGNDGAAYSGSRPITDVLNDLAEDLENVQESRRNGLRTRVPTGFAFLDGLTYSGFNAGNLVILAARPSVGKTAVMLKMARSSAEAGYPVTVYSLEMTDKELAQRLLFATGAVTPWQLISGDFDWNDVEAANGRYSGLPLYLNDSAKTIDDIVSDIITGHHLGRCAIAFIDYLGLIQSPNARTPLYQTIAGITSRLKQVAKECQIPIVLLCQLNRNIEAEDRSPRMSDLRDSGSIEQDADIVLMLERDSRSLDDCNINVWVRKNRNGKAGNVVFGLRANETFTDFETRQIEAEDDGEAV